MKKGIVFALLLTAATVTSAMTFWSGGVLMGTVCRNGILYTVYPAHMAQPVGTSCPVRDIYGIVVARGYVTNE